MKVYIDIVFKNEDQGLNLLGRLLSQITDANPDYFDWSVKSGSVEMAIAKNSRAIGVETTIRRSLGALTYDILEAYYIHKDEYMTVVMVAKACGHDPERIKSSVASGFAQGQLDRKPLDRAYGYRLTAEGLESLANERRRRLSLGIRPQDKSREEKADQRVVHPQPEVTAK